MILVYVIYPNENGSQELAKMLLQEKLIVCANIFPVKSFYLWEGKIENENEYVLILKTLEEKFEELSEMIKKNHPYNVPCIIKMPAQGDEVFLKFVRANV